MSAIEVPEVYVIGTPEEMKFFTRYVIPTMSPQTIGFVADHSGYAFKDQLISE